VILLIVLILSVILILKNTSKLFAYYVIENINRIYSLYCDNPAILNPDDYNLGELKINWKEIRDEYLKYNDYIPVHNEINDIVGGCDRGNKWRTLYLRAYNRDTNIIDKFPKTMEIINKIPCTLAYFSVLEPGAKLDPHKGLYKGVLRYHLGLKVPKDYKKCFLSVDGKIINWREGKDIMFDDMYMHYVENNTDERRVVLFLDIKRDFGGSFAGLCLNMLNSVCLYFINTSDALSETIENVNKFVK
jgi:beta-hydroxylase